ncbi:Cdc6-like AAA superfamily ATPase [Pseudochelatococcus lubricantis]|uniref:Cdc6-like AAA superfamily ATPase n=1 Tax=Pseudochelatococcus lubricantis TaxID=1538102 RepID=A0ABX0V2F7_9HYPH|nr:hypothetical protein [Pseudochelatococcus lubricantis]NIJ57246.1 Cdc6-like AAA superfamily ATPase [Pseudochelatococcus lubricantis]
MTGFDIETELIDLHGLAATVAAAVAGIRTDDPRIALGIVRTAESLADRLWELHGRLTKAEIDAINETAQAA